MDAKTATLLEASIVHWHENSRAMDPDDYTIGAGYCALCGEFNDYPNPCVGCPVHSRTGLRSCKRTPYEEAADALHEWHALAEASKTARMLAGRAARKAARAERDFLISLRAPREERK